jgi:hypothetical protein
MEDNIRTVQNLRKMAPEEIADVRKTAIVGTGVHTEPHAGVLEEKGLKHRLSRHGRLALA